MAKTRVHELAKEFRVESKFILEQLKILGAFVKSASSTVELPDEMRLRRVLAAKELPGRAAMVAALDEPHSQAAITSPSTRMPEGSRPVTAPEDNPGATARTHASPTVERGQGALPISGRPAKRVAMHSLSSDHDLRVVLRECKRVDGSDRHLILDFADAKGFYPSIAVPSVSVIQFFRERGASIELANVPAVADVMRLRNPLEATAANLADLSEPLSRLWVYFDHKQANGLTTAFMDCIRRKVECEHGVLEALEWCLYEVLDNVTQHSGTDAGYAMLQLHVRSKRLAVCVADTGIGVQRSLASSVDYRPRTAFDALTLAVREGVTRDQRTNQGNGLFGLVKIVEQNGGTLKFRSGRGRMDLSNNRFAGGNDQEVIGPDNHGAIVDFQLKVDKPVSLGNALNYEPANLYLESLESADGEHVVSIRSQAGGAGSRAAARELKTLIMNVLNSGATHVVLDFEGQAVVSSSFADEVIGRMFADMGFSTFNQRIKLRSMNPTVSTLVDRAIARRLAQPQG